MIKAVVVGFCSFGLDATLGDWCGIRQHLHSFREVQCLQGYSKTLWMDVWLWQRAPNQDSLRLNPMVANFLFLFDEIYDYNQWGHKTFRS